MDSDASSSALGSNVSAGKPASASAEASAVTGKRSAEGGAAVGSDDEEVTPKARFWLHFGITQVARKRSVRAHPNYLPFGSVRVFGIVRIYAPTLVRVVVFEV